jgi:hypothetical protein
VLRRVFHAWERRLASVSKDRVVRPFEWGLEWIEHDEAWAPPGTGAGHAPADVLRAWVDQVMRDTDRFFTPPRCTDYERVRSNGAEPMLVFPSALKTPHRENDTVYCRVFQAGPNRRRRPRGAVLVLPQWNAQPTDHAGLCRLLAAAGLTALRLSLPYHDRRMPPELTRADYIVSANIGRTVQVCRQAVLDARRAIAWLASQGYERIGILGTSLGSCLALLTAAHEPLVRAEALNHISPHFADVVWRGLSTRHVRQGLEGRIDLELLRALWRPISPHWYLDRVRDRRTLLVYAKYDLTFPVDLSIELVREFRRLQIPHRVAVLPCGHYSTGKTPFKFVDGWMLARFLKSSLTGT